MTDPFDLYLAAIKLLIVACVFLIACRVVMLLKPSPVIIAAQVAFLVGSLVAIGQAVWVVAERLKP